MSEHSTPEERTELPTDRRLSQLRREGALHHSIDIEQTISLMTGFLIVSMIAPSIMEHVQYVFRKSFELVASTEPLTIHQMRTGFFGLLRLLGPDILIIVGTIAAVSSLTVMLQTGWNIREKKIKLDFAQLNPINGIMRVFSITGFLNLG
ncbi:MAG: hypothetical protein EBZ48_08715, partial [Proteobacteria bacterium]|nr:hypothetical protein [Pseudomonadota bacterium]